MSVPSSSDATSAVTLAATLTIADHAVPVTASAALGGTGLTFQFSVVIDPITFVGGFQTKPPSFTATYTAPPGSDSFNLGSLLSRVTSDATVLAVAEGIEVDVTEVAFGAAKATQGKAFYFDLALSSSIDLANLPLVGKLLPATIGLNDLTASYASAGFPERATGFRLTGTLTWPGATKVLSLDVGGQSKSTAMLADSGAPSPHWFSIQKSIGPFHVERIGVRYAASVLSFLFDASISMAGVSLSLEGLAVGSSLHGFHPKFGLDGLALAFQKGPIELAGAFLKQDVGGVTEYDGLAVLQIENLCLTAIGSYARFQGETSLFLYASLDYPLGGPAFFFVLGLSFGFGVHRALRIPTIDQVATFPLVAEAIQGLSSGVSTNASDISATLTTEMSSLANWVPPDTKEDFLAAGIRFTTFQVLDSFVLLAVTFGRSFEVVVLGLSTLVVPTPEDGQSVHPLAVVQMAIEARFDPSAGVFGVQASITDESYVLSPDCHLTGGFALFAWFSGQYQGDFVQTLGGYHPDFLVPSHYPQVARLGFQWQLTSHLTLKGDAYYALCAHALMAGGQLDALFHLGPIKAWFIVGADFLIEWKPFHYEAHVYVDMGISFTFWFFGTHHITLEKSIDLDIWGPDFSGRARIKFWIISFTVSFGHSPDGVSYIDWSTFAASFLPDDVTSIQVAAGLVKTMKDGSGEPVWLIDPKDFRVVTTSVIPCSQATGVSCPAIGIAPMGLTSFESEQTVVITRRDGSPAPNLLLTTTPVQKRVPAALWGTSPTPAVQGPRFVEGAVTGFALTPGAEPTPGETSDVPRAALRFDPVYFARGASLAWEPVLPFAPDAKAAPIGPAMVSPPRDRRALLQAFGVAAPFEVDTAIGDAFVTPPQTGHLAPAA